MAYSTHSIITKAAGSTIQKTTEQLITSNRITTNDEITDDQTREFGYVDLLDLIQTQKKSDDDIELLLDTVCHSMITTILEIPDYLSFTTNKSFQQMIQQKIDHSISSINMEDLGHITILMHQLDVLELEKSLWTHYLRSSTGALRLNESNLHVWPSNVKTMTHLGQRITKTSDINQIQINDAQCLILVNEYLNKLNEKQYELQKQLQLKKKQVPSYTITIDDTLRTFIEEHIQGLCLQYEYENKMVEFNYRERVLDHAFQQQNPTQQQLEFTKHLFHRKYDYEITKQEVSWMKQQIQQNELSKILHSLHISLPSSIQSLTDMDMRQQLSNRHQRVTQQYKTEMITILLDTIEAKLDESRKLFFDDMEKIWQDQRTLPPNERLNQTMIDLIDSHLFMLTEKVQYISR